MTLIDSTYLWGELYVAQKSQQPVAENITMYINKYEVAFLTSLLGATLYEEMLVGLAVMPTPDAKWTTLRDKLLNNTTKVSPIANYVWYWIKRRAVSQATGMGEVKPEGENGVIVSPVMQMTRAWNEMVELNISFYEWFNTQLDVYGALPYTIPSCITQGYGGRFIMDKQMRYPDLYIKVNTSNL